MDIRRLVGRNTRRIRLEKHLSQEQFSELSGFTQQYLSDLERGLRNPTIVTLYELAEALGVEHVALVAPDDEALSEKARRRKPSSSKGDNQKPARPTIGKGAKPDKRKA
jgi:transcriptional regulator with XRE-family HTH domain